MESFYEQFENRKPIIGMVHVNALPGTAANTLPPKEIIKNALDEVAICYKSGIDSVMFENMHDVPYQRREVGHEISTILSIICYEAKKRFDIPVGLQILAGANKAALAAAFSAGVDFIRAESFVFAHIADEGYLESDAAELLRYRKQIGAEKILVFTDIKKKHSSHAITSDINIEEAARTAEFMRSDGLIITGNHTGEEANITDLKNVKAKSKLPVLVGSGITDKNFEKYFLLSDGFIVGSHLKKDGKWENPVDYKRMLKFMDVVRDVKLKHDME